MPTRTMQTPTLPMDLTGRDGGNDDGGNGDDGQQGFRFAQVELALAVNVWDIPSARRRVERAARKHLERVPNTDDYAGRFRYRAKLVRSEPGSLRLTFDVFVELTGWTKDAFIDASHGVRRAFQQKIEELKSIPMRRLLWKTLKISVDIAKVVLFFAA